MRLPRALSAVAAPVLLALALAAAPRAAVAADSARDLVENGRFRAARALLEPRVAADPGDAEAQWLLSQVLGAFGEGDRAIAAAARAVALEPARADFRTQLAVAVGEKANSAGALRGLGLARRFKREAEAALAMDPRQWDARIGLVMFHLRAPGVVGGDRKQALALAEEATRLDPCRGWLTRARYAAEVRDTNRLEGFYRKAVAGDPRSYEARMALAGWLAQHGEWGAAETEARAAQAAAPARAGSYSLLAQIYAKNERWSDLDDEIAAAAAAVPGNLSAQYAAARLLVAGGRELARAERYLRGYLLVEPEAGAPSHAAAHWRLGNLREKQAQKSEALAEYRLALRLDPKLEGAKRDLDRLRKS